MDDKNKLKEELSTEEKELQKIKSELDTFKNRLPKPKITFEDGTTILKIKMPILRDFDEEIKGVLENEKLKNRPTSTILPQNYLTLTINQISIPWSEEQAHKYNEELLEYFIEYEEYIRFIKQDEILNSYLKEISFNLSNEGNAPTGNMDIFISFPEDVKLYNSKSKIKKILEEPIKPQKNIFAASRETIRMMKRPSIFGTYNPKYNYCWDLSKTIGREFKIHRPSLNLKLISNLNIENDLYVNTSECGSFCINWSIHDSALPNPVEGKLNIIIETDI